MKLLGVIKYMAGRLTDMQYFGPGIILRPSDIHWLEPRLVFPHTEILTKLLQWQRQHIRTMFEGTVKKNYYLLAANKKARYHQRASPHSKTTLNFPLSIKSSSHLSILLFYDCIFLFPDSTLWKPRPMAGMNDIVSFKAKFPNKM